jgi:hypothetical protein
MDETIKAVFDLSVMVIIYAGKWQGEQFHPNCHSSKVYDWFEGTGTIIGVKRNRVFILSSIHCNPNSHYSFFVKGVITKQIQINATLCINYFDSANISGIDVAVFSCDLSGFDSSVLSANLPQVKWHTPQRLDGNSKITLVHYPTSIPTAAVVPSDTDSNNAAIVPYDSTFRLFNPVFPTVSDGEIISSDLANYTFDSTIVATGGSSGGLLISEEGLCLGVHDSQHNENPLAVGRMVSTHKMIAEVRERTRGVRQLRGLFEEDSDAAALLL